MGFIVVDLEVVRFLVAEIVVSIGIDVDQQVPVFAFGCDRKPAITIADLKGRDEAIARAEYRGRDLWLLAWLGEQPGQAE